jgi:hypothetical protein
MPLMSKRGKFVFGISLVNSDLSVCIPPQSLQAYAGVVLNCGTNVLLNLRKQKVRRGL